LHSLVFSESALCSAESNRAKHINWSTDGNAYYTLEKDNSSGMIYRLMPHSSAGQKRRLLLKEKRKPPTRILQFFGRRAKSTAFTNTQKVWRLNTEVDYWVLDRSSAKLTKLGNHFLLPL
jgi:dipeptidyl-peptidase-4